MPAIAFGRCDDSFSCGSLKAYLAEFISTFIFVFAGVGSVIAYNKLTSDAALDPSGLVAVAICHGFALFVAVSIAANISGGHTIPIHSVGSGVGAVEGVVMEIIITFALVYTVYATAADPKKGSLGTIAPLAIGLIVGANIVAAGPFSGGSMNPARSFGPAVASGDFHDVWIYWVGPMIGGGLAGLIYSNVFMQHEHAPLSSDF
ncbi:hypothetical protein RJ639_040900 [Escallonia herrerae]|uniref:Uncharacterized protein n=1 Tax=Escallonia herrerae TaxID=1293975 RepID=A0AA88WKV9_9ASTE|nr:hypothetical protein RJ639_040900 [Escallonia herrerae]